ncbi:MAG: ComF family protein, partial [Clostridia bacterium]|nr:ComF family protein [Clostridia bacterium]
KIRQTKCQHHLSGLERRTNLRGAFAARKDVKGKHILLIDDVVTTGATLCECADMLYRAGARKVTCATFAATKYSN